MYVAMLEQKVMALGVENDRLKRSLADVVKLKRESEERMQGTKRTCDNSDPDARASEIDQFACGTMKTTLSGQDQTTDGRNINIRSTNTDTTNTDTTNTVTTNTVTNTTNTVKTASTTTPHIAKSPTASISICPTNLTNPVVTCTKRT